MVPYSSSFAFFFCSVMASTFVASSRTSGSLVLLTRSSTTFGPPSLRNIGTYLVAVGWKARWPGENERGGGGGEREREMKERGGEGRC